MKTIGEMNVENEKTEVYCTSVYIWDKWTPFTQVGRCEYEKIDSGRGGELLRNVGQFYNSGRYCEVKCSKTDLKGKAYWRHTLKGIIDRIE